MKRKIIFCKDPATDQVVCVCDRDWESKDLKKMRCCMCCGVVVDLSTLTSKELRSIKKAAEDELINVQLYGE